MEYYKPIITLISSLIIFHLFFICIFPQSKRFWKCIDYLWISLGVIGIIGATHSLRKEYSIARKNWYEQSLKLNFEGFEETILWNKRYYSESETGFNYSEFKNQTQANNYKRAGIYFDSLSILTKKLRDTILIDKNLNYIDTLSLKYRDILKIVNDEYVRETSNYALYSLKELETSRRDYIGNENLGAKNGINWSLLFLSPYLLAIAMAIRLTKVTAELKEIK